MVHESLVAAKLAVLVLGASVAGVSFMAWRRTRDPLMLWVAVAFMVLALGSSAEGLLFELLNWDLLTVHTVESAAVLAGLLLLLWVLRKPAPTSGTPGEPDVAPPAEGEGETEGVPP